MGSGSIKAKHLDSGQTTELTLCVLVTQADRYLNTKCTRYALRAGDFAQAEETVALFLREGDSLSSLFDMQCAWYENTCGDAHVEQKSFGKALKQYVNVTKHFNDQSHLMPGW